MLPAIAASLTRIGAGVPVHVVVAAVDGPEEEQKLVTAGDLELPGCTARPPPSSDPDPLVEAVRRSGSPRARLHGFVHGEAGAVRQLRRHLIADRGIPIADLSISGYWKRRRTEEGWREDKPEWKRLVEQDLAGKAA